MVMFGIRFRDSIESKVRAIIRIRFFLSYVVEPDIGSCLAYDLEYKVRIRLKL